MSADNGEMKNVRKWRIPLRAVALLAFAMVLLLVEEALAVFIDPLLSLFISLLGAFATAAFPYALKWAASAKTSFQCFSLIFLTRVAVAVVPALFLSPPLLLMTIYGVVLVICVVYIVDKGLTLNSLGFRLSNSVFQIAGGLALGAVMGVAEFTILASDIETYQIFQEFTVVNFVQVTIIMFLFVALAEELIFRGLAQSSFEKELGNPLMAMIAVSLIFAIMHLGYVTSFAKISEIVYVFTAATVVGYAFMKTRSLILPLIAHGMANTILFGILPYLA